MSQQIGAHKTRKCCKKLEGFTQVCNPLRYKPIKQVLDPNESNPMINSDCIKTKCLTQRIIVYKKRKWPLMKVKSCQTSDNIVKDKMTQFPDLERNIKEKKVIEYEVTRPTGSKETIFKTTESEFKFTDDGNDVKINESVTRYVSNSQGSQSKIETITKFSEKKNNGRHYKETESNTKFNEPGRQTRKRKNTRYMSFSRLRRSSSRRSTLSQTRSERRSDLRLPDSRVKILDLKAITVESEKIERLKPHNRVLHLRPRRSADSQNSIILNSNTEKSLRSGGGIEEQSRFPIKNIRPVKPLCRRIPSKPKNKDSCQVEELLTPLGQNAHWHRKSDQQRKSPRNKTTNTKFRHLNDHSKNYETRRTSGRSPLEMEISNSARDLKPDQGSKRTSGNSTPNKDNPTSRRTEKKTSENTDSGGNSSTEQAKRRSADRLPPNIESQVFSDNKTTEQAKTSSAEKSHSKMQSPVSFSDISETERAQIKSAVKSPQEIQSQVYSNDNLRTVQAQKNSAEKSTQKSTFPASSRSTSKRASETNEPQKMKTLVASNDNAATEEAQRAAEKSHPKIKAPISSHSTYLPSNIESSEHTNDQLTSKNVEDEQRTSKFESQRNSITMRKEQLKVSKEKLEEESDQRKYKLDVNIENKSEKVNGGQTTIRTRVYKETEELTSDQMGNVIKSMQSVDSGSDTEIVNEETPRNEEPEIEENEIEEPEIDEQVQNNNCCRGSPCSNSYGYCYPCYCQMRRMWGCNNCRSYPVRPNCNGPCCSRNGGPTCNCCHPRNH